MPNYDYFFAFFWGLAVLGAFIGYGRLVSHLCGWEKKESLGWGGCNRRLMLKTSHVFSHTSAPL